MSIYIDTSAFLALLDADAPQHAIAKPTWVTLLQQGEHLFSTNYVLLETIALAQRRLGLKAVQTMQIDFGPVLSIHWIDQISHSAGMAALFAANRRQLSLVDCTSFHVMRQLGIDTVFAFDQHFAQQGFTCIP
jgi:predicted nucleic acid-binding protein